MTYSAYCQFVFMKNEQADEYGVTFDYEGTLDAVRSHQEDYLAVVNAGLAADKDFDFVVNKLLLQQLLQPKNKR